VPPSHPTLPALHEELDTLRKRLDEVQRKVDTIENTLIGNKEHKRDGLIDDVASAKAFATEYKQLKSYATGVFVVLGFFGSLASAWAIKNLDFVQHLFGKK
jgi:hypothetical protein